jgi:uncharacterized protein (TIRG00374 family)
LHRLALRLLLGLLLAIAVYVAVSIYADLQALGATLNAFDARLLLPVLLLSVANYGLRFVKWHYLLRRTRVRVPPGRSLVVFLSGFSMAITPGKIGELIKSWLLKQSAGVSMTRTAPVVIAERLTDLVALLLLCLGGAFVYVEDRRFSGLLLLCGVAVAGLTGLLASRRALQGLARLGSRLPGLRRLAPALGAVAAPMSELMRSGPLVITTALSALAWLGECLGFWLVLRGLPGPGAPLGLAVFIYAATTVLGALSFLPGGLGVTEGSMTLLLVRSASHLSRAGAAAATVLIRLCTLWFGVLVGFGALGIYRLRHRGPWAPLPDSTPGPEP